MIGRPSWNSEWLASDWRGLASDWRGPARTAWGRGRFGGRGAIGWRVGDTQDISSGNGWRTTGVVERRMWPRLLGTRSCRRVVCSQLRQDGACHCAVAGAVSDTRGGRGAPSVAGSRAAGESSVWSDPSAAATTMDQKCPRCAAPLATLWGNVRQDYQDVAYKVLPLCGVLLGHQTVYFCTALLTVTAMISSRTFGWSNDLNPWMSLDEVA